LQCEALSGVRTLDRGALKGHDFLKKDDKPAPMSHRITIDYPETLPDALHESAAQFEQEARMAMAVKLFELKRLSSGMAAALAGMDRVTFLLQLPRFGVAAINYEASELPSDVANA